MTASPVNGAAVADAMVSSTTLSEGSGSTSSPLPKLGEGCRLTPRTPPTRDRHSSRTVPDVTRGSTGASPTGEAGGASAVVVAWRGGLLPFVALALAIGMVVSIGGADDLGVALWLLAPGVVAVDLVVVTIARLHDGRVAVDAVALVALAASMVMGERLAGVISALMVASGDALEQYAHRRTAWSLSELLSLALKVAHRLVERAFETVAVDEVMSGEVLLVKPGEVVPVDGTVLESAVLDESVLIGGGPVGAA